MFKCLLTSCNLLAYTYVPKPKPYTFFNKKWLVTATGRALHLKHCLVECNVSVFLIVPCWFMWIKHCTKYFLLFAKEMGFFFLYFFLTPPFLQLSLTWIFVLVAYWACVCSCISWCIWQEATRAVRAGVGFYDEIQWQFEVSNHWTMWEKEAKGKAREVERQK